MHSALQKYLEETHQDTDSEWITGIVTENGLPALAEVISYMERHQD